jgi:hypothetical protein
MVQTVGRGREAEPGDGDGDALNDGARDVYPHCDVESLHSQQV